MAGQSIKNELVNKINQMRPLGRPKSRRIDVVMKDLSMIIDQNTSFRQRIREMDDERF